MREGKISSGGKLTWIYILPGLCFYWVTSRGCSYLGRYHWWNRWL